MQSSSLSYEGTPATKTLHPGRLQYAFYRCTKGDLGLRALQAVSRKPNRAISGAAWRRSDALNAPLISGAAWCRRGALNAPRPKKFPINVTGGFRLPGSKRFCPKDVRNRPQALKSDGLRSQTFLRNEKVSHR